ncbi:hypothetical protein PoB_002437900 [Plakobranchus ocellatus]|uniref:RNase H type-1 domain-containing protein n=1 Tax=Plakobranchus ocellatus TaxID=259542 RepID=A0AAV3ZRB6_9GAST|nr:hypothetical protein PoB_002437900 [Plakobranchus ocellatus]
MLQRGLPMHSSHLPETSLYIGPMDRKEETCPLAMKALCLETIERYGREYTLAYSDGSLTRGTGNGGYGIYILRPDGSLSRIHGPVGETTCSYECELMAVIECPRVFIRKQREGAALPGLVIFTDCRALVQTLGGSGSENVGWAMLLAHGRFFWNIELFLGHEKCNLRRVNEQACTQTKCPHWKREETAVSGLPAEDRGDADRGPVASVTCWSPRERDSRWTRNEGPEGHSHSHVNH